MNDILATFTRSEKWLISFVLLLVGGGYGLQEFQSSQKSTMTFEVADQRSNDNVDADSNLMPTGMTAEGRVNINTADAKVLETLPGIGPALAGALIRAREVNGPFKSMADLDAVPGIGPAMMTKLTPLVELGSIADVPLPASPAQSLAQTQAPSVRGPGAVSSPKININTATAEELDLLTGVGPAIAGRILQDRQISGPYRRPEDLMRVKGIGPSILQKNRDRITVQ